MDHEFGRSAPPGSSGLLVLFLVFTVIVHRNFASDCSVTVTSGYTGQKNGTFSSPAWPTDYTDNLQCLYKFVALPSERVEIRFIKFNVRGVPPKCVNDYVDVYTQLRTADDSLLNVPLHGRYCGDDLFRLPHLFVSTGHVAVVGFYTDAALRSQGFFAEYTFIDDSKYWPGERAGENICGQTIDSALTTSGVLLSPTYPGVYPDNVFCFYKIRGAPGERIRLHVQEVNMYSGGSHCPFDYVKIYDGFTNEATVIDTLCGRLHNVTLFSTGPAMHVEFVTRSGRITPPKKTYVPYWDVPVDFVVQRTGFKAVFDIRDSFVDLGFIKGGHHLIGTECDQRILSTGQSNGTITSPNFPDDYPVNVTCHYYIDGYVSRENLEKTELYFIVFDMPSSSHAGCREGCLSAYVRGREVGESRPDHVFCGGVLPPPLVTSYPRLLLRFDTHGRQRAHRGFKAVYQFVTDFAISGTPASEEGCHFIYRSSSVKSGKFNSPRHPTHYPSPARCTYEFIGHQRENVRISFNSFVLEDRFHNCSTDYLQVFSVTTEKAVTTETLVGHYCGDSYIPGPIVTSHEAHMLKVTFQSDDVDARIGFSARYEFIDKKSYSKKCFLNMTSGGGGHFQSPNYPHRYLLNSTCEWHVYVTPPNLIAMQFSTFSIEGSLSGCAQAVLKVYTNASSMPTYELCGAKPSVKEIMSQNHHIKIRFISSSRAVGAIGFQIAWTEVTPNVGGVCHGFTCAKTKRCIASRLHCNKLPNCGLGDKSDEGTACGTYMLWEQVDIEAMKVETSYNDHGVLHVVLGIVVCLLLLVFAVVCIVHRRRTARKRRRQKEIEVRYVTRSNSKQTASGGSGGGGGGGAGGGGGDSLLLEEHTTKVSVVW